MSGDDKLPLLMIATLKALVEWFDLPQPTTPEQDEKFQVALQFAREVVGSPTEG